MRFMRISPCKKMDIRRLCSLCLSWSGIFGPQILFVALFIYFKPFLVPFKAFLSDPNPIIGYTCH